MAHSVRTVILSAILLLFSSFAAGGAADASLSESISKYDLTWNKLTSDPVFEPGVRHSHWGQKDGYYDGAIMGNGLLGTNFYKLCDGAYRLNVGRSDVTEAREKWFDLFYSGRLPIGYFTLKPLGKVQKEEMRLHIYDAQTTGSFHTDKGKIDFNTYVHATRDAIIFETIASGGEQDYEWDFVPQQAISPTAMHWGNKEIVFSRAPKDYMNKDGKSNPDPYREKVKDIEMLIQPLAADTSFTKINRYYIVAWSEFRSGANRRVIASVSQDSDLQKAKQDVIRTILKTSSIRKKTLEKQHRSWWHAFYDNIATMNFPDSRVQGFYWMQCYKFASTARPGKPIVDLQGVWPTYDTPWPAIWMNLNIQLTYSWQTRVGLSRFAQPLWDALWDNRDNLRRNVTDNPGQETWTECLALPRASSYDMHSRLDPKLAEKNAYEAGNLTWTLFYCYRQCLAEGDDKQMRERLFPLLKGAVNLFFRLRTVNSDGTYSLPPTASPEYKECVESIGTNSNYDLANLRWGLQTLISIDEKFGISDPLLPEWKDFLEKLVPFRYNEKTGFMVSDKFEFLDTTHRHYSHLFMIYPYHLLDWDNPADYERMALSVDRWQGNTGYSLTGKASMLCSRGDGDEALVLMKKFLDGWVRHNTLYNESGPVIETPFAAMSSFEDMYMQDWGDKIRIFWGCPSEWKNCSFNNMRAAGGFRVSARRTGGKTEFIQITSNKGGLCRLQTGMKKFSVKNSKGKDLNYKMIEAERGIIEVSTKKNEVFTVLAE
jgi:alpha-L-fucosidase 2